MRYLRWAWAEAVYLAWASGLRRYCVHHDVITWGWRHRDCCARKYREIGLPYPWRSRPH